MAVLQKTKTINPDELLVGAYLKRKAIEHPPRLYEVEFRDGPNITLRDVMVPARQCVGSHQTCQTTVRRVCNEFELVVPWTDDDWLAA